VHARVSTYQFPSANVDASIEQFTNALGTLDEPGLERADLLIDRTTGKALTITVWESEEALQSSAEAANRIRSRAADTAGVQIVDVSHFEIIEPGAS
jgi:heme-degrading monooxygenase HmoA